jgi:hypothetical protein
VQCEFGSVSFHSLNAPARTRWRPLGGSSGLPATRLAWVWVRLCSRARASQLDAVGRPPLVGDGRTPTRPDKLGPSGGRRTCPGSFHKASRHRLIPCHAPSSVIAGCQDGPPWPGCRPLDDVLRSTVFHDRARYVCVCQSDQTVGTRRTPSWGLNVINLSSRAVSRRATLDLIPRP